MFRDISSVDKRLISTEEIVLTRRGESKAECCIKKAVQNGSSIYALCPNAISINKILRHESLKRKWVTDRDAKFTEITFRDTIIPPGQYKRLFGEIDADKNEQPSQEIIEILDDFDENIVTDKKEEKEEKEKNGEEKEEEKEEEDKKEEKEEEEQQQQNKVEHRLPHKKSKVSNRVKVNKLSWISLE